MGSMGMANLVERKGQPAWSVPLRKTDDPSRPFFSDPYRP